MTQITVELDWPSRLLHPNARVHWAMKSRVAKVARRNAYILTLVAQGRRLYIHDSMSRIPVAMTFYPPDRHPRDEDGMVSSLKSALDGVADALQVDDKLFKLGAPEVIEPPKRKKREPKKPGKVLLVIG